jgi:ribosomal-protein-alanine N-acetyltransferase
MMGFLRHAKDLTGGVRLEGDGIYLRHPRDGDWTEWAELRAASREFLQPWEPTWGRDALTRIAYRQRLRQFEAERREGSGHAFFIFQRGDDALIDSLADYAFGRLGLHRLEAACQPHNEASRELLRRFGFAEEGRARLYLLINGRWSDHLLFGLVRDDYLARRQRPG